MKDFRDTLRLALEPFPEPAGRWLSLNAHVLPGLEPVWREALACEQPDRGTHVELEAAGYASTPEPAGLDEWEGALVLATRSRARNEWRIALARSRLPLGAPIIVCGAKTDGIASLRKRFGPALASLAKHHATAFTIAAEPAAVPDMTRETEGWTIPRGTFSDAGPDVGSTLLAPFVTERARGTVADLGAGWGYLAAQTELPVDAYESDAHAVAAIPLNAPRATARWHDVVREPVALRYDTVVMNPPFHRGRAADPSLGLAFVARAAEILRPRGRLLMVANRQLPYEAALDRHFKRWEKLADRSGFKVFEAVR